MPAVTIDPFESDNETIDGIVETAVDGVTSAGYHQENVRHWTDADVITSGPLVYRRTTGR